jgi:hypothetical protein
MHRCALFLAVGALGLSASAPAAPIINGSYIVSTENRCQIVENVDSTTGVITLKNAGDEAVGAVTMTFHAFARVYTFSGFGGDGSNVVAEFSDGSRKGNFAKLSPISGSGTYSNDDTTLYLNGTTPPYQVIYGPVVNGSVQSFIGVSVGTQGTNRCIEEIIAHHQ